MVVLLEGGMVRRGGGRASPALYSVVG